MAIAAGYPVPMCIICMLSLIVVILCPLVESHLIIVYRVGVDGVVDGSIRRKQTEKGDGHHSTQKGERCLAGKE